MQTRMAINPSHRKGIIWRATAAPAASDHPGGKQAAAARLRQTDDLLPAQHADAGGSPDVLIISTPHDQPSFERLLGDGSRWGMEINYAVGQSRWPGPEAFLIGADFLNSHPASLVLGDNLFDCDLVPQLIEAIKPRKGRRCSPIRCVTLSGMGWLSSMPAAKSSAWRKSPNGLRAVMRSPACISMTRPWSSEHGR